MEDIVLRRARTRTEGVVVRQQESQRRVFYGGAPGSKRENVRVVNKNRSSCWRASQAAGGWEIMHSLRLRLCVCVCVCNATAATGDGDLGRLHRAAV